MESQIIAQKTANTVVGFAHPNIDPVLVEFGMVSIRWYSLAYLFGIILGWSLIKLYNRKYLTNKFSDVAIEAIPIWIIVSIILGGRIGYVVFYNFEYYLNNFSQIIQVWQGGMSFHGGLIGVIVGLYIYSKKYKVPYLAITDIVAVATPIGLFLGRLANFINKELIGRVIEKSEHVSWGVIYPGENFARHPSQLYEAAGEGLLLFIIINFIALSLKQINRTGVVSSMFLMFYACFRFGAEFFRAPDEQVGFLVQNLTMGQLLCAPMFLVGLVIFFISTKAKEVKKEV